MNPATPISSSRFSLRRVWAFAEYYMPRLKGELLIYAAISLICALLCLIPTDSDTQATLFVGVWTILPILYYCGPLIFAKGADTRILERLIPVSAAEKMCFYYVYILIVIPVVVFLLPLCASWIYLSVPSIQTDGVMKLYETKFGFWGIVWLINLLGGIFIAMVCLWSVEFFKQNRMMMGIVGVITANIIIGFLGIVLGVAAAWKGFKMGFYDGLNGIEQDSEKCTEMLVQSVMEDLNTVHPLSIAVVVSIIILIGITAWSTYRSLRSRNL